MSFGSNATNPGGGGGGGGTILLRVTGGLALADGSKLSANGHAGGNVNNFFAQPANAPGGGGGGGGGRIKLFYREPAFGVVALSTAAGLAGSKDSGFGNFVDPSTPPAAGAVGSVSFGVVASSPTLFAASLVHPSSISWTWSAAPSFGDAPAASQLYRVFPSTCAAAPPAGDGASLAAGVTERTSPEHDLLRFVTAFTDWGDSARSTPSRRTPWRPSLQRRCSAPSAPD